MASNERTASERPLSFMDKLSPEVSIYRPSVAAPSTVGGDSPPPPKLIIIGAWTDAKDVHIAKYIVRYRALYPTAQILLIRSTTRLYMNPSLLAKAVLAAVPAVRSCFPAGSSASSSPPELLIHIFSNGGSSSIASLYNVYAASAGEGEDPVLPSHVTIFDSGPAVFRTKNAVEFLSAGMSSMRRFLAAPIFYFLSLSYSALIAVGIIPDWMEVWGRAHNDAKRALEARRAYIYSATDAVVNHKDVEAHANEAESKGYAVRREKFEGSAHVLHVRKDEERYWEVVRNAWEKL